MTFFRGFLIFDSSLYVFLVANGHSSLVAAKVARQVVLGRLKQIVENCSPTSGRTVRLAVATSEMPPLATGGQVPVSCRDLWKGRPCKNTADFCCLSCSVKGAGQPVAVTSFQLKP